MTNFADKARMIVAQADSDARPMTKAEIDEANEWILRGQVQTLGDKLGGPIEGQASTGGVPGLYDALKAGGFDRRTHPVAEVGFRVFTPMAASFDGNYEDAVPTFKTAPPLGADRRFLFSVLRRESEQPTRPSVSTFRQESRTLPTLSTMIRDIDAVTAKPETSTQAELVNEPLHQIATVETGVPNIMLENAGFRGWINDDLTFAYASAVDAHVTTQIAAATPAVGGAGGDLLESILLAAETVAAAGYNPTVLAGAPETLIDLQLLVQPGTGDYVFSGNAPPLQGMQRVAVTGLPQPYVIDPAAAGTFYVSSVRVATFEEANGTTNSSTVRIESNGVFVVQRVGAIAEAVVGS